MEIAVYIGITIVLLILVCIPSFLKFSIKHKFKTDVLIQKEKDDNKITFLYGLNKINSSNSFIDRYTIISDTGDRSLLINYVSKYNSIEYNVYLYNMSNKIIKVLRVEEKKPKLLSEYINLPKTCKKINIEVTNVDGQEISKSGLNKASTSKIVFFSLLQSALLYTICYLATSYMFRYQLYKIEKYIDIDLGMMLICLTPALINFVILCAILINTNKIRKKVL